jgi:hypothetical protein
MLPANVWNQRIRVMILLTKVPKIVLTAHRYYQTTIFRTFLGLDVNTARILSATVFTWQTLCAPLGAFTIEKVGRRKLMLFGAAGMGMCMA